MKIKGIAKIIETYEDDFEEKKDLLQKKFGDKFQFDQIIEIVPLEIEKIVAPSYFLFPDETTEESQRNASISTYKMKL